MTLLKWAERAMRSSARAGNFNSVDRVFWWARTRVSPDGEARLATIRDELDGRVKA